MTGPVRGDPVPMPARVLRKLGHSPAVSTAYVSRGAELALTETERVAAVRQGYDDGYADGLAQAAAAAARNRDQESQRTAVALSALSRAVAAAQDAAVHARSEVQAVAPELAFALLEALLARETALAANPGCEAVTRALALDEGTLPATVRLNPLDVETLGAVALGSLGLGRETSVLADPAVEPGGAVVDIGPATLDGQLGPALERVRRVLLGDAETGEAVEPRKPAGSEDPDDAGVPGDRAA